MRQLPNIICLLRIALVWPVIASIEERDYELTLALFLLAAVSDGFDGYLAKRFNWTSELGGLLDPLADKLLLVAVFLVATWLGLIPRWLTVVAVARDVMIGLGALIYRLGWGPLKGRPMVMSKINTLFQLLYVLAVVAHAAYGLPPQAVLEALAFITLVTLLLSGYGYARQFVRRALLVAAASH